MITSGLPPVRPAMPADPGTPAPAAGATPSLAPPTVTKPVQPGPKAVPESSVEAASTRAARALFAARQIAVSTYYDEATSRVVARVADRRSGEVLFQSPPEELLRFYASGNAPTGRPLVEVEA